MTNQSTIDKLIEMRLTAMADAFRIQMDDPTMKEVPFEDRFGMLVDIEYSNRKNNRLKRLIRQAEFEQPDASIAAIDYQSGRKLNKALISRLATCEYITEYRNIFITGATGSGKTYMACAFGMEACKHYYTVRYRISNETVAIVAHWLLLIIVIVGAAVAVGVLIVIAEKKVAKVYRENCWDVISVGVMVTSVALVVYFGDWIKGFVKLNFVVLLLLVQAVYVGIRAYVKGCKRARGYY